MLHLSVRNKIHEGNVNQNRLFPRFIIEIIGNLYQNIKNKIKDTAIYNDFKTKK